MSLSDRCKHPSFLLFQIFYPASNTRKSFKYIKYTCLDYTHSTPYYFHHFHRHLFYFFQFLHIFPSVCCIHLNKMCLAIQAGCMSYIILIVLCWYVKTRTIKSKSCSHINLSFLHSLFLIFTFLKCLTSLQCHARLSSPNHVHMDHM